MRLIPVDRLKTISKEDFTKNYAKPLKPLVIEDLSKTWPAGSKWNPEYFKTLVGDKIVPLYDNSIPQPDSPLNKPDAEMKFAEYLDLIMREPTELRIFLFNIFKHVPELCKDFSFHEELMKGFVKSFPMMFFGGAGSKVYLHYDIDLSHVFLTQFSGRKKVILFDNSQSDLLYRLPYTVQSYIDPENPDYEKFPALKNVNGYVTEINNGETLFMPSGCWHYMNYLDGGYALSLRSIDVPLTTKLRGAYNLFGMRYFDDMMKRCFTQSWYHYKHKRAAQKACSASRISA